MEYVLKVIIPKDVDEVSEQRIRKNLNQETLKMLVFPKQGMPLTLGDRCRIKITHVEPLQSIGDIPYAAEIDVRPIESRDVA